MLKEHLRPPSLLGPQPPVSVGQSWHVQVPSFSPFRPLRACVKVPSFSPLCPSPHRCEGRSVCADAHALAHAGVAYTALARG
jgi:hypothetical protein